ncbi:MAG: aspartate--tRNA(Asn) ligase [Thaumarchaeota archaeon 13_1_40CM_3_50_5]|nr:MAG: aspartate--tRNA(Asn) ligase [Thaumarchaeota archaeon 13_1_40CM_4_48_7]OLC80689.1 MAG: aspartate--tRNA(Asn) ligase [Thaumarchaeota archaeon 13_1_40CM_3_50_5]
MLQEQDLGHWRRTHYSSEINPSVRDGEVVVMGWVTSVRDHGNIQFIILKDMHGEIQITVKKGECSDPLFEMAREVKEHSSIGVRGKVRPQEKAPNGAEVVPAEIRAFSIAKKAAPFMTQGKSSTVGIDTRLDLRAVDLRRNYLGSIFRIRQTVLNSVREFLARQKFIEVNTPKMIATATEGGSALFPIFYYDKEAFLAQSPQLYKEQLTMAFESVFEIGPIFRAEPSRTNRHLSEAISIDVERAFVDYNDVMSLLERMIVNIVETIKERSADDLEFLELQLPAVELPFPKYTYSDLIDKLQEAGERIQWGDDISPHVMKSLQDDRLNGFYFIIDWPTSTKPFYVKPDAADGGRVCESFDLMFAALEISSGSTRINRKDQLVERMKKQGLKLDAFEYHLRVFDYGVPPHAGFGLGLERLMMALTKVENIRDATLYPRDIDRLTP